MGEINSSAITAIHDSEFESFAASTLFTEGWSVLHRALDWASLIGFLSTIQKMPDVLLLSTNLTGIEIGQIETLQRQGIRVFLFQESSSDALAFPHSIQKPENSLQLIGLIRGSIRSPLLRNESIIQTSVRAHVLTVGSAHGAAGCTSLTINLATELALTGKKVLLVDAHMTSQSIAILLGLQGLHSGKEVQEVTSNLWAMEVTRANVFQSIEMLNRALTEFDLIVIDIGTLTDVAQTLSGRRWSGEVLVWVSVHGDDLWVMSKSDRLGTERLRRLVLELSKNLMKPSISCVQSFTSESKRAKENDQAFLAVATSIRPKRILRYALDSRSIAMAEREQCSLYDSNERSLLRKSVLELSGELEL
jgi:cellulose biosynthesis protein BcsQ